MYTINAPLILKHLGHKLDRDFTAYLDDNNAMQIRWHAITTMPTAQEILDAEAAALAAQSAEDDAAAQDVIDRQVLKDAASAIKADIQTILSNANAYIASPATTNAQANAQLLQITKDLKSLTLAFAYVTNVVKGLV